MIRSVQQGLLHDGLAVPVRKLCAWFDVLRRTVYLQPTKSPPQVDLKCSEPIKALIEEEPSFGHRIVAWLLGFNVEAPNAIGSSERAEHGAAGLSDQGLAGAQAVQRWAPRGRGPAVGGRGSERVPVARSSPCLGRTGWLGHARTRHGLPMRERLGWHLSRSGKASTAVSALEHAPIARFGTPGRVQAPFLLLSDNGLVFTCRAYTFLFGATA